MPYGDPPSDESTTLPLPGDDLRTVTVAQAVSAMRILRAASVVFERDIRRAMCEPVDVAFGWPAGTATSSPKN